MQLLFSCKYCSILAAGVFIAAPALAAPRIFESVNALSHLEPAPYWNAQTKILPRRIAASFGVFRSFLALSGRNTMTNLPFVGGQRPASAIPSQSPACGPSIWPNTMECYDLLTGSWLASFPIPGNITLTPLFVESDNSLLFGTSKGFLVRTTQTFADHLPDLGFDNAKFWGQQARITMQTLRAQAIGNIAMPGQPLESEPTNKTVPAVESLPGIRWAQSISAEFIGSPLLVDDTVYVLAANQYLHAFDWNTGKLLQAPRLAPETSLRISAAPLSTTGNEILLGTDDGTLVSFRPRKLDVLWKYQLPIGSKDVFRAVVAKPLVDGPSIIVSNAESMTQRVSLANRSVEWSYPMGSVAEARINGSQLLLGGHDGTITALDLKRGIVFWKTTIHEDFPVGSIHILREEGKQTSILAVSRNGMLALLDENGKILDKTLPLGDVVGEFIVSPRRNEACLAFMSGGFRCFRNQPNNAQVE